MNFPNTLKLDSWWSITLWSGVALFTSGLIFNIEIVNRKHLMGLGIGMFIIGLVSFISLSTMVIRERDGQWTGLIPVFNTKSKKAGLYAGCAITVVFGTLLLISLF